MADSLSDLVKVTITKAAAKLTRQGFGRINVLAQVPAGFTDLFRNYTSLPAMISDGFTTSDLGYKAAQYVFAQQPRPKDVRITKRTTPVAMVVTWTPTVANTTAYSVTLLGRTYGPYTSDGSALDTEIVTALRALIDADAFLPLTSSGTTTLIMTADNAGAGFSYSQTPTMVPVETTPNVGAVQDILEVVSEPDGDNWYGLILAQRNDWVAWDLAQTVETLKKLFLFQTSTAAVTDDVYSAVTPTDVASMVEASALRRTSVIYHDDGAEYLDAGIMGAVFPYEPGATLWKYHGVTLATPAPLNEGQIENLKAKNCNWYELVAGISIFREGRVGNGTYLDIVHGQDALERRMAEDVFGAQVRMAAIGKKFDYTAEGLAGLAGAMTPSLQRAEDSGLLAKDPKFRIIMPEIEDIDPTEREERELTGAKFSAFFAGGVQEIEIDGEISFA